MPMKPTGEILKINLSNVISAIVKEAGLKATINQLRYWVKELERDQLENKSTRKLFDRSPEH